MEILELLNELTEIGNPIAFADVATGAQMAMAAMRGAAYNVLSNLLTISDEDFTGRQRAEISDLITEGRSGPMRLKHCSSDCIRDKVKSDFRRNP